LRSERSDPAPDAEPESQATIDILSLLAADDRTVMDSVGRWYIPGRDVNSVRRNALIVLGNTADPADPDVARALEVALADPDPVVRGHAVWAARRLGRVDLLRDLQDLRDDPDELVVDELTAVGVVTRARSTSGGRQ
jgi:HEAT repeat protein